MRLLVVQSITEPPGEEAIHLHPDFLITRLNREGIGRIEARMPREGEAVPFVFKTRHGLEEKIVAEIGRHHAHQLQLDPDGLVQSKLVEARAELLAQAGDGAAAN